MDYSSYNSAPVDGGLIAAFVALSGFFLLFALVAYVATALGMMQFFKKASQPGWAAFVPFYNMYVMTVVAGIPMWWFWLLLASILFAWVPVLGGLVTLVTMVYITYAFLQKFGKDIGHTVLAVLFPYVYYPVVGFSKDLKYSGSQPSVNASTEQ